MIAGACKASQLAGALPDAAHKQGLQKDDQAQSSTESGEKLMEGKLERVNEGETPKLKQE